jgi:hypothetical protein
MNKTYCPECADLIRRVRNANLRVDRKVDMARLSSSGLRVGTSFVVPGTSAARADLANARRARDLHIARSH